VSTSTRPLDALLHRCMTALDEDRYRFIVVLMCSDKCAGKSAVVSEEEDVDAIILKFMSPQAERWLKVGLNVYK